MIIIVTSKGTANKQTKMELKKRQNQISSCGDDPNVLCFSCLYFLVVADLF